MAPLGAQLVLTPEYERLRRFEGTYEAEGGGTLQILASPRDSILVAAVGGGRYPLKTLGGDLFMNGSGQRVRFSFERGREGYTLLDIPDSATPTPLRARETMDCRSAPLRVRRYSSRGSGRWARLWLPDAIRTSIVS